MSHRLSLALAAALIVPVVAAAGDTLPRTQPLLRPRTPMGQTGSQVKACRSAACSSTHPFQLGLMAEPQRMNCPRSAIIDPREDGWTIQGFEFGSSLRLNDWFEAFGNFHLYYDNEAEEWNHKFEEWFGKIKNLPGGFELRGGRYLNRFGFQNSTHLHGWDFAGQ